MPTAQAPENHLGKFRLHEGLSQRELARFADVDVGTIRRAENREGPVTDLSKSRIVYGLNSNPRKRDANHRYTVEEVFPNG